MAEIFDDETHLLSSDYEMPRSVEDKLPREDIIPSEEKYSFDEDNSSASTTHVNGDKRRFNLKSFILKPIVSIIAVTAVVYASYGRDPLGSDFLNKDSTVLDKAPSAAASPLGGETTVDTADPVETDVPETDPPDVKEDDVFPVLDNLDPDFAGDYAWSGAGSEEYVRFYRSGDTVYSYLVKGSAWDTYDSAGKVVSDESAVYDKSTNTLTLRNFTGVLLDCNLMGNGFTVRLEGENYLDAIQVWGAMYGGSITFDGDGSLTVGQSGIYLSCENSASALIIKSGVTLDVKSDGAAVYLQDTTFDEPSIYISKYLKVTGGTIGALDGSEYSYTFINGDGEVSNHIVIEPIE